MEERKLSKIALAFLLVLIMSCSLVQKKNTISDIVLVDESSGQDFKINGGMLMFCKSNNVSESIGTIKLRDIIKYYQVDLLKNGQSFMDFISDVYDLETEVDSVLLDSFILNDSLYGNYCLNGFKPFQSKYLKRNPGSEKWSFEYKYDDNFSTLLYIFYLNGYLCYADESLGKYYCIKFDNIKSELKGIDPDSWFPMQK